MKIKRFTVANMQAGLKEISEVLGPEAVILSNRRLGNGLEIVAGVDEQEFELYLQTQPESATQSDIIKADPNQIPDSLDKAAMSELFSAMADKNKQVFDSVQSAEQTQAPTQRAAPGFKPEPQVVDVPKEKPERARSEKSSVDSAALKSLRREIDDLKNLLKEQTEQLKEPITHPDISPQYERLEARMHALGFGRSVTQRLMKAYERDDSVDSNWRRVMNRLVNSLPAPLYDPLSEGGIYALVGPTGAGKTTTLAKLAAHGVKDFGQDNVAVISMDWFQVGGQQMLKSVTDILGVSYVPMKETDKLEAVLKKLASKKLVLIDTSGSAEAMSLWDRLMAEGNVHRQIQNLLVLPATLHCGAVNPFLGRLKNTQLVGSILSKVDEAGSFGSVLEPILKHRWPLWYVTTGQQIPQDIEVAESKSLVQRLVRSLQSEATEHAHAG